MNDDDDIQDYVDSRQKALIKEYNYEREMRNRTIEEVAKAVHGFKAFEKDTMDSFAAYIRGLKR
jgi:hypothetical protein